MIRLGKLFIGWGETPVRREFLPELILCRDYRQARAIRLTIGEQAVDARIRVAVPSLPALVGPAPPKVTVMPGVDLDRDMQGEGTLRAILLARLQVHGGRAVLIEL